MHTRAYGLVSWTSPFFSYIYIRKKGAGSRDYLWPASDEDETTERTTASTKRIDTYVVSDLRKVCSSARSEAITSLVVDWISANSRLISVVEDTGLKQLFGYIEPAYSLPSRTQVTSIVKKRHASGKKRLLMWKKKPDFKI